MRERRREQIIFDGDPDTYTTAKKAATASINGFLEIGLRLVPRYREARMLRYVCPAEPSSISCDLPREIGAELMEIQAEGCPVHRKAIRGGCRSKPRIPAGADGQMYPLPNGPSSNRFSDGKGQLSM